MVATQVWHDTTIYDVDSIVCDREGPDVAGRDPEVDADIDEPVYTCYVTGRRGSKEASYQEFAIHSVTVETEGGMPDSEAGDLMHHVGGICELSGQSDHHNNVGHLSCREDDSYESPH